MLQNETSVPKIGFDIPENRLCKVLATTSWVKEAATLTLVIERMHVRCRPPEGLAHEDVAAAVAPVLEQLLILLDADLRRF